MVIVGDGAVGKTCMLYTYSTNSFPEDYYPHYHGDNLTATVMMPEYKNHIFQIGLWDTAAQDDYDRLRPLSYPETNVFFIMFSLVDPISYENVKNKWVPEIKDHCPDVPIVLVGSKLDLREDPQILRELRDRDENPITKAQGFALCQEIKAFRYHEISSKQMKGLKELFHDVCRIALFEKYFCRRKKSFFDLFKKKNTQDKETLPSKTEFDKFISLASKKRILELKVELEKDIKDARGEFKTKWRDLSQDVVLHILREFFMVNFSTDCYEFHNKYIYFLSDLGFKKQNIILKFFGCFKEKMSKKQGRSIQQLFFSFRITESFQKKYLPRKKKMMILSAGGRKGIEYHFTDFYTREIVPTDLINVKINDLKQKFLLKNRRDKVRQIVIRDVVKTQASRDSVQKVLQNYENIKTLGFFSTTNTYVINLFGDLKLEKNQGIENLLLWKTFSPHLSFSFKNLKKIRINVSDKLKLHDRQMKSILRLEKLENLSLESINLVDVSYLLDSLFMKKSLKVLVFFKNKIDLKIFEGIKMKKRTKGNLELLMFLLNENGVIHENFLEELKKNDIVKYYIRTNKKLYENIGKRLSYTELK